MLNPYAILGAVLVWLASLAGVGYWQHGAGVASQKVADQAQFDSINARITDQKTIANKAYRDKQDEVIAALADRDKFKNQLEAERGQHRAETDALRNRYAGIGLRFTPAQAPRLGAGGDGTGAPEGHPASADAPAVVQLPDAVAGDLRQLAFDADRLKDEYATCYGYANGAVK